MIALLLWVFEASFFIILIISIIADIMKKTKADYEYGLVKHPTQEVYFLLHTSFRIVYIGHSINDPGKIEYLVKKVTEDNYKDFLTVKAWNYYYKNFSKGSFEEIMSAFSARNNSLFPRLIKGPKWENGANKDKPHEGGDCF